MEKDRDWVDYAQLGLTAAQACKINKLAGQVAKLQQAAASQEKSAQRLSQMRQMVLMAEELLGRLEADPEAETTLQRKFVYTFEAEDALKLAGVLPPLELESYEDKERVGRLEKRLDALRAKTAKAMTEEQRQEAELCVRYMAEEPDLKWLITERELTGSADRKKKRLQEVEAEMKAQLKVSPGIRRLRSIGKVGRNLVILGVIAAIPACNDLVPHSDETMLVALGAIAVGIGLFLLQAFKPVPRKIQALQLRQERLKREVSEDPGESGQLIIDPHGRDPKKVAKNFGGERSVEQLRQMWIERRDFVRRIVGDKYLSQFDNKQEDREAEA